MKLVAKYLDIQMYLLNETQIYQLLEKGYNVYLEDDNGKMTLVASPEEGLLVKIEQLSAIFGNA